MKLIHAHQLAYLPIWTSIPRRILPAGCTVLSLFWSHRGSSTWHHCDCRVFTSKGDCHAELGADPNQQRSPHGQISSVKHNKKHNNGKNHDKGQTDINEPTNTYTYTYIFMSSVCSSHHVIQQTKIGNSSDNMMFDKHVQHLVIQDMFANREWL